MIRPLLCAALLLFQTGALAAEPPASPMERVENGLLPRIVEKGLAGQGQSLTVRMAEARVPGLAIAVVHEGRLDWSKGYGVAEVGTARRVTAETLFLVASVSKPVAAVGASVVRSCSLRARKRL